MADIFLSYAREDQETARLFADGLEAAGLTVWWDVTLRSGEAYDEVTEEALREAKAVVVLWSRNSVDSRWVRAEATHGDKNKILAPAMIEPCERPILFELTQAAELFDWKGDLNDPAWNEFVDDLRKLIAAGEAAATAPAQAQPAPRPTRTRRFTIPNLAQWALAGAVLIAAGAFLVGPRLAPQAVAPTTAAVDPHRLAECNELRAQNVEMQARSARFAQSDLAARATSVSALIAGGKSGSDIYYAAIEDTATPLGDYAYLSHYWEVFGACVNDATLRFDAIASEAPFPEAFWNQTRDLRHLFARNWRGQGRVLPDFMSNFAELCGSYRAQRARADPYDTLDCTL